MTNEYEALKGLTDPELRLNLLHWVGARRPKATPSEVMKEAEAVLGYIRFGVIAQNLDILPAKKLDPELLQEKLNKLSK